MPKVGFNSRRVYHPDARTAFRVKASSDRDINLADKMVLGLLLGRHKHRPITDKIDARDVTNVNRSMDLSGKNVPLFQNVDEKWGWKNELLLLQSVKSHGLFNWQRVAKVLSLKGQVFDAKEVEDHYKQYYWSGTLGCVWNHSWLTEQIIFDPAIGDPALVHNDRVRYFPEVSVKDLKSIKFMPHREEFQFYPPCSAETALTVLEFAADEKTLEYNFGPPFTMDSPFGTILRNGQLAIVDNYRKAVAERAQLLEFMREFKLIEQYFHNGATIMSRLKSLEGSQDSQKLNNDFTHLIKYVQFFSSYSSFYKFYHNCVKEKLIKMEIKRLYGMLKENNYIKREPLMHKLLKTKAPFFLNAGALHYSTRSMPLKLRRKKQKFKFTRRKQTK